MEIYLARQSIFDKNLNIIAYEILFRSTLDNKFIDNKSIDTIQQVNCY